MYVECDEAYEELRQILEKHNMQAYSFEEVKEIGDELLGFYMLLIDIENRIKKGMIGDV